MKDVNQEVSAGSIIFRNDPSLGPCVLMLKTYNKYDLPKGHVEKTDADSFSAAARETQEECGITIIDDPYADLDPKKSVAKILHGVHGPIVCNNINNKTGVIKKSVLLYPVETLCPSVTILPNKKTGIYEHQSSKWVPVREINNSELHRYLQDGVHAAIRMYETHLVVENAIKNLKKS